MFGDTEAEFRVRFLHSFFSNFHGNLSLDLGKLIRNCLVGAIYAIFTFVGKELARI